MRSTFRLPLVAILSCWLSWSETGASFVDRVCKLGVDPGSKCSDSGKGQEKMYYFDMAKEKCVSFNYLGCEGNQNKFGGSDDCIDSCQTPYFIKKNNEEDARNPGGVEPHKKSDCTLPPVPGPCKALITMWFYNPNVTACEQFGYGGCNGNSNKFDTRRDCENFCGSDTKKSLDFIHPFVYTCVYTHPDSKMALNAY